MMIYRPIAPLKSLRRHLLVAIVAFSIFLVAAVIAFLIIKPLYRTGALILVSPRFIGNLDDNNKDFVRDYREYARNQIFIITSYEVLKDALLRMGDNADLWRTPRNWRAKLFGQSEKSDKVGVDNLEAALQVELMQGSNMISLALEETSPEYLAETVNAVAEAYLYRSRGEMVMSGDERIENLRKRKRELQSQLREMNLSRNKIAEDLGSVITEEKSDDPFRQTIESLYSAVYDAGLEAVRARAGLRAEESRLSLTTEKELFALGTAAAEKTESVRDAYKGLMEQRALLESLTDNLKPGHPKRTKVELEIAVRTKEYNILLDKIIHDEVDSRRREMAKKVELAKLQVEQTTYYEEQLKNKLADYQKRMQNYNSLYQQGISIQREIARVRQQLEKIDDILDKFVTEENAPGSIKLSSIARYPEAPNHTKRVKIALAILFFGLFASVGSVCLLDMMNPWVLTPSDIAQKIGAPPLACIINGTTPIIHHYADDQVRRMVLSLEAKRSGAWGYKVLVTSVKAGGGTTELCFRMCRAFSKISVRPLLIEANIFNPSPRYQGGDHPGFIDIIRDLTPVENCLLPADHANDLPDRVAVGNLRHEKLLPSRVNLKDCFTRISGDYDICIIDTPPILLSADAEHVARSCDAAILVVEAETIMINEMVRAVNLLTQITENVALVLNRAVIYPGSGYYETLLRECSVEKSPQMGNFLTRILFNKKR